jgi:peptide subunit release factor 1 (eRF1)
MTTMTVDRPLMAMPASSRETLERLAGIRAPRRSVVTCYIRLDVEDRTRRRYLLRVRREVQRIEATLDQLGLPPGEELHLRRDLARIVEQVSNAARLPHTPGVLLVACEALGVFEIVPLSRVRQTRILIDDTAQLAELASSLEATGRMLVAVVDRAHARFFAVTPQDSQELPGLITPSRRGGKYQADRKDSPGWGEHDYHNRIREERHRQAAAVVRHLTNLVATLPVQGLVLAGPERITTELERFLPHVLRSRLLGRVNVNPTAVTPAQVQHVAMNLWRQEERRAEQQLVEELLAAFGTGWAVDGPRATLRALARGQLRALVLRAGQCGRGFRCAGSGRLVLSRIECRDEGEPVPVADLVNAAIEDALRQRLEVVVLDDPAAGEAITSMAGYLRFR